MVSQKKKKIIFVFLECFHMHRNLEGEDGIRASKIKGKEAGIKSLTSHVNYLMKLLNQNYNKFKP